MMLEDDFERAVEEVKTMRTRPTKSEAMELYGLYKQVRVGDVNTDRPGILDFVGKTKWDGWEAKKGMTKEDAMMAYIATVAQLIAKYGLED